MTFSYDPTKITEGGKDQLRFELGDTVVDMGGIPAVLSDQEYDAILGKYPNSWRSAKFYALQAIVMKLSYEVDTSVGGLSYSLNQRFDRWKKMLDEEKKAMAGLMGLPTPGDPTSLSPYGGTPYFYNDMQRNWRR